MAYIRAYVVDIFVSYALVDDQSAADGQRGWVTTLVHYLKNRLAQKLGRADSFSLWMDRAQSVDDQGALANEIKLPESALFLIVLSQGYLTSSRCRQELALIHQEVSRRGRDAPRVFVVEIDKVDRPPELRDLLGIRFWTEDSGGRPPRLLGFPNPDPNERHYFERVNDLANDLVQELKRLKKISDSPTAASPFLDARATVFLAEATDDLDDRHDEVRRYLVQMGLTTLPQVLFPNDEDDFRRTVTADLEQSLLFVQLLSGMPGRRLNGSDRRRVRLQYECAVGLGLPVMQWRNIQMDLSRVVDLDNRALLEGPGVMACTLVEFMAAVARRIEQLIPPPLPSAVDNPIVFVDAEPVDFELARQVGEILARQGITYILPALGLEPLQARADLEETFHICDALLLVYGQNTLWARSRLRDYHRLRAMRGTPLKAIGLYDAPPPEKSDINFKISGMQIINGRTGLDEGQVMRFLETLKP